MFLVAQRTGLQNETLELKLVSCYNYYHLCLKGRGIWNVEKGICRYVLSLCVCVVGLNTFSYADTSSHILKITFLSSPPASAGILVEEGGDQLDLSSDRAALHPGLWARPALGEGEVKLLKQDRKSLALSLLGRLQRLISPASSFSQKPF